MRRPLLISFVTILLIGLATVQSNGQYTVEKAVIAGGGGTSSGGGYTLEGTIGQPIAGGPATGSPYSLQSGFWGSSLGPTAAGVFVEGRVTATDRPISGAYVVITLSDGTVRQATTNTFGRFRIVDLLAGQTVIVDVQHRRYRFAPQTIDLSDSVTGLEINPV